MFDPVGVSDIARRLGVSLQTPAQWKKRCILPTAEARVNGQDVWNWTSIETWARNTGRLSPKVKAKNSDF